MRTPHPLEPKTVILFTAFIMSFTLLSEASPVREFERVDVHVHLAALPDATNGCWMSDAMRHSWLVKLVLWRMGWSADHPSEVNQAYVERLVRLLRESHDIHKGVLLALDGSYDEEGRLDRSKTNFLIPNDYLFQIVHQYPDVFLPGCSINPQRRDALAEVERCAKAGAVLVKVLPNAQAFDPGNLAYIPFYQALARHHLPLLCHVGKEFSVTSGHQDYGDPARLELALKQGVTVIAAHGMSYGLFFREPYFKTMLKFAKKYPNFYMDASALSLPNRVGMLLRIRRRPELVQRMIFGTDYPLPSFAYPALLLGHWHDYRELCRIKNPFDRQYRLLRSMGFLKSDKEMSEHR